MRALPSALLVLAAALAPSTAHAYQDQLGLALAAGYSVTPSPSPSPQHGAALQLEVGIGLGDTFELRGLAGYAIHVDSDPLHRVHVGAEIVYLLDILEFVPFFGVGVDFVATFHTAWADAADFGGHGVVGLDWLLSREWALGLEFRPYVLFTRFVHTSVHSEVWMTALIRAQMLFEI